MTRFDGIRFDVVGINCVEYDNIVVAPVGGDWKTPCLVCVKLTLDVNHGHKDHVCLVI